MTTATLYLAFRLFSGTILVFCLIFLISENAAAPFADSKREIQGASNPADEIRQSNLGIKSFSAKKRQLASAVVGNGLDKVTNYMLALTNFVNGNTDISKVDNYMAALQNLMQAKGVPAMSIYSMIIMNFWVFWDSIGWFFRFNENRLRERIITKIDRVRLANDTVIVDNLIETLNITNLGLEALKKSMELMICQDGANLIKRDGKISFNQNDQERQVDCSSILKRQDENGLTDTFQDVDDYDYETDQEDEEGNDLKEALDFSKDTNSNNKWIPIPLKREHPIYRNKS